VYLFRKQIDGGSSMIDNKIVYIYLCGCALNNKKKK